MAYLRGVREVPEDFGPSVVTIGKFDGVHIGHRAVIARLRAEADARDLPAVALTFDRNPLALLAPDRAPVSLVSPEQRAELLRDAGVDTVVELPFDRDFAAQTPGAFVEQILVGLLGAAVVLVGSDFRFGHRGSGTLPLLRVFAAERGFEVVEVGDVAAGLGAEGGRRVSSSLIRELLDEGRVREATVLLARAPTVRGTVVRGFQRGRQLGYPTANLSRDHEGYLPGDGVYASRASIDGGAAMDAATSIGNNPTFEGVPDRTLEAHVLDRDLDLYDRTMEVAFVDHIRPMRRFEDMGALTTQMRSDESAIRRILGDPSSVR
ncbi:MAG: bifunctional riboflavin kinase/FAD synthetase [Micrococcales bacterium]|nr:bifunctional riboflavin kinase/FAD synthetase [Micrococcales bacterium]